MSLSYKSCLQQILDTEKKSKDLIEKAYRNK